MIWGEKKRQPVVERTEKDREYEKARNKLIPSAIAYARVVAGQKPQGETPEYVIWATTWNRSYHQMMDALARQHRLVR